MSIKVFTDGTDIYAAESTEQAQKLRFADSGVEVVDPWEEVDGDKVYHLRVEDGVPGWVADEPEAEIEDEDACVPTVSAPARVWAKREGAGFIGSSEW